MHGSALWVVFVGLGALTGCWAISPSKGDCWG